jgi:LysR family transcriptional regulator, glycine cleavage system transcriptional activator
MRRLPPLTGLEAFVQVARLGSMKAAAAELNLSNPALSRRIQTLERILGQPLFARHHQALKLTSMGERLLSSAAPLLDELADAVAAAGSADDVLRLTLNVLPLFASQRLFPRMPELRSLHPNLHIDIETLSHGDTRLADGADAAIALAREIDPTLYSVQLDQDFVYPIVAKRFAEGADRIASPEQLARMTVLIHSEMPETFNEWRRAIGMPYLEPAAIDRFDSGQLMLEAAAQGVGVAFMLGHHLDDAHDTRLSRLFDFEVKSPYSYYFACRPRALRQPAVKLFHDWLVAAKI